MRKTIKREKLLKNSRGEYNYQFNWKSGGFNDVWAKNITEFRKEVKKRFGAEWLKDVDFDTVYKATASERDEMIKLGWRMMM